jgi:chitodextrinase
MSWAGWNAGSWGGAYGDQPSILTTVAEPESLDLTDLATVKDELGISGSADDARLTRWIHEVSSEIATHCNRQFGRGKYSEAFWIRQQTQLPLALSRRPVVQVDSVTERDGSVVDPDAYTVDASAGLLSLKPHWGWPYGKGPLTVAYQAGYILLTELPSDLERAALLMLSYRQSARGRDPMIRGESLGNVYSAQYWVGNVPGSNGAFPPDIAARLEPYREFPLG